MAFGEKALLRKVRRYVPPGVRVVVIEMANANPIDAEHRSTPVVLTDRGLMLVTASGSSGLVTDVPYNRVSNARSQGNVLTISFRDDSDRPRTFDADFGRGGTDIIEPFLAELRVVQPGIGADDDRVPAESYHAAWDHGRGATFDVFKDGARQHIRPTYDHGVAGLQASELCKQAMMDLSRAISDRPELVWVRERAEWMPEFVWDPPLPSSGPSTARG